MNARRVASTGAAVVVAAIAAYASYSHMRAVALHYGQTRVVAALMPLSVDGAMVVATIALGDGRRHRWSAWLTFWTGVAASVFANVLAAPPSVIARCISAWPAVAFLLTVEVITRGGRGRDVRVSVDSPNDTPTAPVEIVPMIAADEVDTTADQGNGVVAVVTGDSPNGDGRLTPAAERIAWVRAQWPDLGQDAVAERTALSARTVQRHWRATQPSRVNGVRVPELIDEKT